MIDKPVGTGVAGFLKFEDAYLKKVTCAADIGSALSVEGANSFAMPS